MIRHVVVVGAGAAGFMAAIAAREAGARVTLLESTADGGRKILISGGGRCNVLPSEAAPGRFVSDSPRTLVRALLGGWPLREQRRFFEQDAGVPLALEAESGKLFPASNRAQDVRDALSLLARTRGAELRFRSPVTGLRPEGDGWTLETPAGLIAADRVVLATGGLSVPATGSNGAGLGFARALGHVIHPTYAALTPLRAVPAVHGHLAGVSLEVALEAVSARERARARGGFLFTHRGYSGPAVLDVSHVAVRSLWPEAGRASVRVSWTTLDRAEWTGRLAAGRGLVTTAVATGLPQRLAEALVHEAGIEPARSCAQLRRDQRERLLDRLTAYELPWTGDEGYRTAEVTGGGVALDEVHRATLESKRAAGLHVCGELLDAFGPIGGHNFNWAWSTGRMAGLAAARTASRAK
ncbi:MAG TPA: aminoacetone oxidase family FAD-binding enzyme [Vicinamibacterales bacterium]|nr:aminoacetone oxidase family FAD-binding enzyme [Vicinamibacterales bacterium]